MTEIDPEMYKNDNKKKTIKKENGPSVKLSNKLVKLEIAGKTYNLPSVEMFSKLEKTLNRQANEINRLQHELNQLRATQQSRPAPRNNNKPGSAF